MSQKYEDPSPHDATGEEAASRAAIEETRSASETSPASALEAGTLGRTLGRFYLLDTLGRGGMGVVIAAYDPALDRKVAIKLLRGDRHAGATRGRAHLVAEAQAMARLSHPNVVAVHEVAFDGDAAYLVMEHVTGPTLRGWLAAQDRSWPEILAMFVAAGQGLDAAHRADIVHGDFKPDNVLVDRDGRARVGDFGLAAVIEEVIEKVIEDDVRPAGSLGLAGTLPYMAPEQLRRGPCDARSDQYAYCFALWEALHGNRPFVGATPDLLAAAITAGQVRPPVRKSPDWLRAVVLRGLRPDPAARWPSMAALLDALRSDPRVRRRRIAGAAALVACAGALWALWPSAAAGDPCAASAMRLAGVWDAPRKIAVHAAFAATGLAHADETWRKVDARVDRYAASWGEMSREACRATRVEGRQSDTLMDLRMACLEQHRGVLGALSALWARGVNAEALAYAVDAASGLAPLAECADARALADRAPPPSQLAQASLIAPARRELDVLQALVLAHHLPDAKRAAVAARAAADATGWAPIRAAEAFAEGEVLSLLGDRAAEARLLDANRLADEARDDGLRARVLLRLIADLADKQQNADAAARVADLAEGVVARAGGGELRGRLLRVRGKTLLTAGKYTEARALFGDAATRLRAALGASDALTIATVADQAQSASLAGDAAGARRLYEDNLAVAIPALGEGHPTVATLLDSLGSSLSDAGNPEAALPYHRRALAIEEQVFGPDSLVTATTLVNLGRAEGELHRIELARAHYERALAIREHARGPDDVSIATPLGNLALLLADEGQYDAAVAYLERAIEIKRKGYGTTHAKLANSYELLGQVLRAKGDLAPALEPLRHALDIRSAALGADHVQTMRTTLQIGELLARLQRCAEARPLIARGLDALTKADREPTKVVDALVASAGCDLDDHQPAVALARVQRAVTLAARPAVDLAARGAADWMLARTLAALGRHDGAVAAARKAEPELSAPESAANHAAAQSWLAAHAR